MVGQKDSQLLNALDDAERKHATVVSQVSQATLRLSQLESQATHASFADSQGYQAYLANGKATHASLAKSQDYQTYLANGNGIVQVPALPIIAQVDKEFKALESRAVAAEARVVQLEEEKRALLMGSSVKEAQGHIDVNDRPTAIATDAERQIRQLEEENRELTKRLKDTDIALTEAIKMSKQTGKLPQSEGKCRLPFPCCCEMMIATSVRN